MFRKKLKLSGILALMVLVVAVSSANSVFAYSSVGNNVINICSNAANPLLNEFQGLPNDCNACHDDGSGGGSGGGKTAARGNDSTVIAFFCPPVEPPPPPPPVEPPPPPPPVEPPPPPPPVEPPPPPPPVEPPPTCTDKDGDGFNAEGGDCGKMDCNDNDFAINPTAAENCTDGIDNNCNGRVDTADVNAVGCPVNCTDKDGDGYSIEGGSCGAVDCNDSNMLLNPAANEICDDNIDNNCDGTIDAADVACQVMEEDEHRKKRHDRDRDEHDDDDDDDHEAEDDDDDHEARDRKDRRKKHRRNRRHHDD